MKKLPFYSNTPDNTHCFQASIKIILKYFYPNKEYSWKELEDFSGKKEGLWTWPTKTIINLNKLGLEAVFKADFDYKRFAEKGGEYLVEKNGEEVAKKQIKFSDMEQEQALAREIVNLYPEIQKVENFKELKKFLDEDYILLCNVNYYGLYGKEGFAGHFVVVYKIDDEFVYLQDPGLPPNPNAKISFQNFIRAWEYPSIRNRNFIALRKH